jgi:hypothetical protein
MNQTLRLKVLAALGVVSPLMWHDARALDAAQPSDSSETVLTTIIVTAEKAAPSMSCKPEISATTQPWFPACRWQVRSRA